MRKVIVAGNWKMNKTPREAIELIETLKPLVSEREDVEVVFCPPFISLMVAVEAVKGTNIKIGAQNMYFEENGAYTGEVAPDMIAECGVEYVILGHSERRQYFGETDESINKKVKKAFEHGLKPIICVGETLEQREQGITEDLVRLQTKIALKDISKEDAKKAVIAYEPVWAIGTGKTATSVQAEEACAGNGAELSAMPNIDGGLVGGASLKADFAKIVNY